MVSAEEVIFLTDTVLGSPFSISEFSKLATEIFGGLEIDKKKVPIWAEYRLDIDSVISLGIYESPKREMIEIFVVKLKKSQQVVRARSMQRNFVSTYLKRGGKDAAIVAFYVPDEASWRFSFIKLSYEFNGGKIQLITSPYTRYSYLVGESEPSHTARQQIVGLLYNDNRKPTVKDLEEAFSVDKVTKEFFEKYKSLFHELSAELNSILDKTDYIRDEFEKKEISVTEFSKRLLGQIVFLYFLQKKGWLGVEYDDNGKFSEWGTGSRSFLKNLLEGHYCRYNNFFNDVLEPLFYDAFAIERDNDYYSPLRCKIPFLNGGLFEPYNDYSWTSIKIPLSNNVFRKIFETFDQFNFTVKEDDPLEREVAVDPEILGKVFEEMLEITDRKKTGSYYTPREIVHYMCQFSLANYLKTYTKLPLDDLEKLIVEGDFLKDSQIRKKIRHVQTFTERDRYTLPDSIQKHFSEIEDVLQRIKIADPAVGSGAFIVGMMNEIVKVRSLLILYGPDYVLGDEEKAAYNLKREIVENSLYGVDIDPSAIDIAKLRIWLSLVVDEVKRENIDPLPNLDYKIMVGNSIVEDFEGISLEDPVIFEKQENDFTADIESIDNRLKQLYSEKREIVLGIKDDKGRKKHIERLIKQLSERKTEYLKGKKEIVPNLTLEESVSIEFKKKREKILRLAELKTRYFNEQSREPKKRERDLIRELQKEIIIDNWSGTKESLAKWLSMENSKNKPYFLWKMNFPEVYLRENPGFDIVIGNPPYGLRKTLTKEEKIYFRKTKQINFPSGNIAELFVRKVLSSLVRNKTGQLVFIIPKKSLYGQSWYALRELWIEHDLRLLMDASQAFENVRLEEVSFSLMKSEPTDGPVKLGYLDLQDRTIKLVGRTNIEDILWKQLNTFRMYSPTFSKTLLDKIYVKAYNGKEPFFTAEIGISNITKDMNFDSNESIPCLKGIDITNYGVKPKRRYLRMEKALPYLTKFEGPKVVAQEIIAHVIHPHPRIIVTATYDEKGYLFNDTCVLVKAKSTIDEKLILGYLQSMFVNWFLYNLVFNRAIRTMHLIDYYVSQIPIPNNLLDNEENKKEIIKTVDEISNFVANSMEKANKLENDYIVKRLNKIDQIIYDSYELDDSEISEIARSG